jgi:hypothetical protein
LSLYWAPADRNDHGSQPLGTAWPLWELPDRRHHLTAILQVVTVLFDIADFETVAALMKPHHRQRLSEEERLASAERLKAFSFKPGHEVPVASSTPEIVPKPLDDPEHV